MLFYFLGLALIVAALERTMFSGSIWIVGLILIKLFPQDIEVASPPDDSISCLEFSPPTLPGNFLIAGSWANDVSNKSVCDAPNLQSYMS